MSEQSKVYSLTATRLVLGTISFVHGLANTFGVFGGPGVDHAASELAVHLPVAPVVIAWVVALVQLVAGLSLLLGPGARWSALALLALLAFHLLLGERYEAFFVRDDGCEFLLAQMALCSVVAAHGPGALYIKIQARGKE